MILDGRARSVKDFDTQHEGGDTGEKGNSSSLSVHMVDAFV